MAGTTFSGVVAEFNAPAELPVADFIATINWGDGQGTLDATVVASATPGQYLIIANHTYAQSGNYVTTIVLYPTTAASQSASGIASVIAPLPESIAGKSSKK